MKIAFLCNSKWNFDRVYSEKALLELSKLAQLSKLISYDDLKKNKEYLNECDYVFTTWDIPVLTEEEIEEYLPNIKAVFYAAGSVQGFAKPYLNRGVRIFSAFAANAVPVAEYTFAQICLALKGYFGAYRIYKDNRKDAIDHCLSCPGMFDAKVGIVGLGAIGSMIAEKLKVLDVEVLAYDPFVSKEKAEQLNVKLVSLEEIFRQCNVISNHLANKEELNDIYNIKLFSLMKDNAVFINTGRGAQVNEEDLAEFLKKNPNNTALIDVIKDEVNPKKCPFFNCSNAFITPHIAGSSGYEVHRMAYYMIDEFKRLLNNENPLYEITPEMLKTMA